MTWVGLVNSMSSTRTLCREGWTTYRIVLQGFELDPLLFSTADSDISARTAGAE
ncbi:MAG: hypothetical protein MZU95_08525 [Desulfomicrobium escambiense]|nr:hypothetical protein [Desulfomicrobium escambiense]